MTDHIGSEYGDQTAFHPRSPFRERQAKHKGKIYVAEEGSYVALWHIADVQRLTDLGPLTGALPTFGAERRFGCSLSAPEPLTPSGLRWNPAVLNSRTEIDQGCG